MSENSKRFIVYLSSYLGVAMIGGSIVHIGTIEGQSTRYIILGAIGVLLMIVGSVLEARLDKESIGLKYFGIATALAIATGFLSGGIQHFLDNPVYAGYLLAIGLVVAYLAFSYKYNHKTTALGIVTVVTIGPSIVLTSNFILDDFMLHTKGEHNH